MIVPQQYYGTGDAKPAYADFVATLPDPEPLGADASGDYTLYGLQAGTPGKPAVVLIGGVHGNEWIASRVTARVMSILRQPEQNRLARRLHFYAIPNANPWGYERHDRRNANGVNMARNCDYKWDQGSSDPGDLFYRGPAPWSEPETQLQRDIILDLAPVAVLDIHGWGGFDRTAVGHIPHPRLGVSPRTAAMRCARAARREDLAWYGGHNAGYVNLATIYNWARHETSSHLGHPPVSVLVEVGTSLPADEGERQGVMATLQVLYDVAAMYP